MLFPVQYCSSVSADTAQGKLMVKLKVLADFGGLPCTAILGLSIAELPGDLFWAYGTASGLVTCCHQVSSSYLLQREWLVALWELGSQRHKP